jgi:hypothetical protein
MKKWVQSNIQKKAFGVKEGDYFNINEMRMADPSKDVMRH